LHSGSGGLQAAWQFVVLLQSFGGKNQIGALAGQAFGDSAAYAP
jgi:hypothetical protein